MKIRTKLSLIFFVLVIIVVSVISISIYFFFADYRENDFYRRLKNRATNTALLLVQFKEIDAELLKKMENENPASLPMQFVSIYDTNDQELYSSDVGRVISFDQDFIDKIRQGSEVRLRKQGYEILGFLFDDKVNHFVIIAGANDLTGLDALENLRGIIMITFTISLFIVSILAWIYSGRVLDPISRIVDEVDTISAANLNQRLDEGNGTDELSKLSRTFNRMLTRIEAAFLAQKNFIANASHELKTPFTVMAGEIQVTLLHPRDNEYYVKILTSVLEVIKRFNKLSTQLLLLAQTSADNPQKRFSVLRFDDILWDAKHELEHLHPEYEIEIQFEDPNINHDFLLIHGDEQLLKVLIMNLMDNGCKYSDNNRVLVKINISRRNYLTLDFINTGAGIEPEEREHIFDPFYRGKGNKVKGFGIGLSLASKILKLHDGEILVESTPQTFTRFTISLPIRN